MQLNHSVPIFEILSYFFFSAVEGSVIKLRNDVDMCKNDSLEVSW